MKDNYFGQKLKELRLEQNLSQRQLGDILGCCNQTISFWENSKREPDLDSLVTIAKYFNVSADFLLGLD
ncbi:MAG: helix-turn-helix domain-containing protein [Candidatus Coproplasma sp.]